MPDVWIPRKPMFDLSRTTYITICGNISKEAKLNVATNIIQTIHALKTKTDRAVHR